MVGRIEAGRAWSDLATVARLGKALNIILALTSASAPARLPEVAARPAAPAVTGLLVELPLEVDLAGLAEPTAAHVIEAILHNIPRLAGHVEDRKRLRPPKGQRGRPW